MRLHLGCILMCIYDLVGSIFPTIIYDLQLNTYLLSDNLVINGLDLISF